MIVPPRRKPADNGPDFFEDVIWGVFALITLLVALAASALNGAPRRWTPYPSLPPTYHGSPR